MNNKTPKKSSTSVESDSLNAEGKLICEWQDRKQATDNGLFPSIRDTESGSSSIGFALEDMDPTEKGYTHLLQAKVFEIFGVSDINVASAHFLECVRLVMVNENLIDVEPHLVRDRLNYHCRNLLSMFQEIRPRDALELTIVTKVIMLNYLSSQELIGSVTTHEEDIRNLRQKRGIKLSRLMLEFKEKLDKHRRPSQQIHVQHNHIYNEGQAIIGSQLSAGGGR